MYSQAITELEQRFHVALPAPYRAALIESAAKFASEEFCTNADDLAISNDGCRKNGVWGLPWPNNFWWVGDDGCGGLYFINCDEPDGHVYYFDHEDAPNSFDEIEKLKFKSLAAFLVSIEEGERQFENDCEVLLEKIRNRKWWQFWVPRTPPHWAVQNRQQ
jgi:hypothetical protein